MLTPPSELPSLPKTVPSYWPIHAYTLTQIVVTVVIFIVTLTVAGPAFPVLIIALVPIRLFLMNRVWNRETLRYVDGWACREGTPEGDEDKQLLERTRRAQYDEQETETEVGSHVDEEIGLAPYPPQRQHDDTTSSEKHDIQETTKDK